MPRRRENELNNLNESLHSIISGDAVNIPFVDETPHANRKTNGHVSGSSSSESLNKKAQKHNVKRPSLVQRKRASLKLKIEKNLSSSEDSDESDSDEDRLESERRDKPGPLESERRGSPGLLSKGLRRNSISMPVLNEFDLDKLRALHMKATSDQSDMEESKSESRESFRKITVVVDDSESMICSMNEHESEKEEAEPMVHRTKFRTKRRHSIAPLPAIRLNDGEMMVNSEYDAQSIASAAPSITSIGSLASLLKEKMQSIPSMIRRRKKPKDYKIRAFVAILFLIIVFLIGYAYIMYNQKVMSRLYFDHIKFSSSKRMLHVYDAKGIDVLSGNLGAEIAIEKPYGCIDDPGDGSVCWEWTKLARLYVNLDEKFTGYSADGSAATRCYTFRWESLDPRYNPIDCFNIGEERGQWYGGGITRDADWQLERGSFGFAPFITGDISGRHQWGNAMKRYFINSHGVAIEVTEDTPLHISVNGEYKSQFCLKAQYDNFAFVNRPTPLPQLKYRICTASDMKILHHNLTQKNLWDGLKEQDVHVIKTIFDEPVWQISENLTDTTISNYTDKVIELSYFRLGHVLISEQWQRHSGDFELDEERFKGLDDIINVLHRRGFRISFTISPFVSTESKTFAELVKKKLLIYERSTERNVPALTKFGKSASGGILDPTNNDTIPWLILKLDKTVKKYQIDSFFLDFGTAYDMPQFYECKRSLLNPDHFKTIFTNGVSGALNLLGVSGAISVPRPPAFLNLPSVNSSWRGLQTVITSVLNYGIIGYPFIMPGAVGGDILIEQNGTLPDKELYIRWLQLATFLPVLRFTHLPSEYKDETVTEIAKELASVRQKTVTPVLNKYLSDAMNEGLPLVRPLWMLDPHDVACLNVVDEFSVGEQLIVAPILEQGKIIREVYLPQGVWKDGVDGSLRKGSRWIHNYRVPEDKIAYFVKMPDNTRF